MSKKLSSQQKMFNIAFHKLLKQNRRAMNGSTRAYRAHNGTRCAIGHCIPDRVYNPRMEGRRASSERVYPTLQKLYPGVSDSFVDELQYIHDYTGVENWRIELTEFGKKYGLTIPQTKPA